MTSSCWSAPRSNRAPAAARQRRPQRMPAGRRGRRRTGDPQHRFPSQRDRRRPPDRAPERSAHADQSEAAGLADHDRLQRHRSAEEPAASLRHDGFRHAGDRLRCRARQWRYAASCSMPAASSSRSPTSRTMNTWSRCRPRKKPGQNAAAEQKKEYKGERLTLNFQDIETRAVLQLLADASGQNIVVSDTVSGSVTLRLQNVPWDQALDIVLRTKGLDKRQEGNVIIVAPAAELAAREKADLAAKKDIQELEPLHSEYLQVNYAKASDIANLLRGTGGRRRRRRRRRRRLARTPCCRPAVTSRSMIVPTRCCCRTRPIASPMCAAWWRRWTSRCRQVLIEARIVVVTNDFERDLGALIRRLPPRATTAPTACMRPPAPRPASIRASARRSRNLGTNGTVYPVSSADRHHRRQPLQRQSAGRESGRQHRARHSRIRLPGRSGARRRADRKPRHRDLLAAR